MNRDPDVTSSSGQTAGHGATVLTWAVTARAGLSLARRGARTRDLPAFYARFT